MGWLLLTVLWPLFVRWELGWWMFSVVAKQKSSLEVGEAKGDGSSEVSSHDRVVHYSISTCRSKTLFSLPPFRSIEILLVTRVRNIRQCTCPGMCTCMCPLHIVAVQSIELLNYYVDSNTYRNKLILLGAAK